MVFTIGLIASSPVDFLLPGGYYPLNKRLRKFYGASWLMPNICFNIAEFIQLCSRAPHVVHMDIALDPPHMDVLYWTGDYLYDTQAILWIQTWCETQC